jgi:hypothetical protein
VPKALALTYWRRVISLQKAQSDRTGGVTMTSPQYISEDKSEMRGIKHGWYAMEDDGNLSSGPFSSREECIERITQPTNGPNDGV